MIEALLMENGVILPGADWSDIFPHWLIATVDDEVIGCLMMLPAKPVSFFEFLHVKKSANFKLRALAVRKLMLLAIATATVRGSCFAGGVVSDDNRPFAKVIEKINFVPTVKGAVWVKQLKVN